MKLGIDLGGTKTEIVALDADGRERYRRRVDTPVASYDAIVATLAGLVNEAEAVLGQRGTVGVGIPGTISAKTGLVKNANTTALNGRPLDRDLGRALAREVRCLNDANCLALSEAVDGAGAGRRDGGASGELPAAPAGLLSGEASEFLVNLAADADDVARQLAACQQVIINDRK